MRLRAWRSIRCGGGKPFLRLLDGIEAGWAIPLLLGGFVVVWMAFLVIAYSVGDLHSDVLEAWTFGRNFDWGSAKHPPLMGWIARAWTSAFPLTDWSFQLLALVNSATALWFVDLISRRFVTGDKRIIVLLLLMLPPTYQFFAQRFNANAVLLPVWPAATYCFLRSFETREVKWAAAAGATAALAMLGKYYSAFLIGSFVFAAICHPQRRAYFGSPAPWISAAVGLLHWDRICIGWRRQARSRSPMRSWNTAEETLFGALNEAFLFVLEAASSLALPACMWAAIAGRRLKMLPRDLRQMNPDLLLLFGLPSGRSCFRRSPAIVVGAHMPGVWASQGLFLFVVLLVCTTSYPIERFYTVNLIVIVAGMALVAALIVAPVHALYRNTHPLNEGRNFYRLSALELTRLWHDNLDVPLPIIGGDEGLALATAFYSPDHPLYEVELVCPTTDEFPKAAIDRGWAALCFAGDGACLDRMARTVSQAPRIVETEFTVQSALVGLPGAEQRVKAFIIPPSGEAAMPPISAEDLKERRCKGRTTSRSR